MVKGMLEGRGMDELKVLVSQYSLTGFQFL